MATNHGVGGSNPSSPTTGPKGKDLSLWGSENHDRDSGRKAIELGYGLLSKWNGLTFSFYLSRRGLSLHIVTPAGISLFMFYSP